MSDAAKFKYMYTMTANDVLAEVLLERYRQDQKWGQQDHGPMIWLGILAEEFGEVAKEANDFHFGNVTSVETRLKRFKHGRNYRAELIQVAAVAVAMVESFDRNEGPEE